MRTTWNAESYERVSRPQAEWAKRVLQRLPLAGHEAVLDAGCGSGRVTQLLIDRLPRGRVVAVDQSPDMIEKVRSVLRDQDRAVNADLAALELDETVDAVFSNAVFHWVLDHGALFERLALVLRPSGRVVAQCGGAGNVERFHGAAREAAAQAPFAEHLEGWTGPWRFATAKHTAARLEGAGFTDVRTWLEPSPVVPEFGHEYLRTVCLGAHLERLPEELRDPYVAAVADRCGRPLELDYVRLNIDARRAA